MCRQGNSRNGGAAADPCRRHSPHISADGEGEHICNKTIDEGGITDGINGLWPVKGRLTAEVIYAIMSEEKPNQREKIKLSADRVREYFPKSYTTQQMEDTIIKLLEQWHRQQQRKRNDAR